MRRIIVFMVAVMGVGLFLAGQMVDRDRYELRLIQKEIVVEEGVRGQESRLTDGRDTFYYSYRFPNEVIEERFSMDDINREFYMEVVDYEREGSEEYLVELQGAGRGVLLYKGGDEVAVITVERASLLRVEEALRKNKLLEGKMEEKFDLLKEALIKK